MSSTRTVKHVSDFHQERYASSPEFERGLNAGRVAARCSVLDDPADRQLIWFIQHLSHLPGGLASGAAELLKKFPHRLGTPTMFKLRNRKTPNYNAKEVAEIREEMPLEFEQHFPLRGEVDLNAQKENKWDRRALESAIQAQELNAAYGEFYRDAEIDKERLTKYDAVDARLQADAQKHPDCYPVESFRELCRRVAEQGSTECGESLSLEKTLAQLCLNPANNLQEAGPWYFSDLVNVLREHHQQWIAEKSKAAVTTLGRKVCDGLDYCAESRSLVVMEGNTRLGKSFAARSWVAQHPGKARFVEVPGGNDDKSFFHALARGLGLGSFLNYKVVEIRQRVESVLLTGDILLVMDEGQRLFPQRNFRCAFPGRVVWMMTMANAGVPICVISTPQFILAQNAMEKMGWNSAQLTGRIGHYEFLPTELSLADLMAVGRAVLPEASAEILEALASYARVSARYLAAVDSIAKRAQFIAKRNGRVQCTAGDVRTAMQESVIPSDTMLVRKLEQAKKNSGHRRQPLPIAEPATTQMPAPRDSGTVSETNKSAKSSAGEMNLISQSGSRRKTAPVDFVQG